jgi:hypothetical protein
LWRCSPNSRKLHPENKQWTRGRKSVFSQLSPFAWRLVNK